MQTSHEILLCRHHYDPLDRLVASTPANQSSARRFYQKDRLSTEIQGAAQYSILQHDDQLLAQQQRQSGTSQSRLLATDQQRSVLNALDATRRDSLVYTAYGHRPLQSGVSSLLGFNGERPDEVTGHYLLGNGYRAFNPVLMRFNSPDSWSPFGEGGLNAYAYCAGDPMNHEDRTGHVSWPNLMAKHFPKATISASKWVTQTSLDSFEKIQGAPHITEQILNYLPSKDIGSLGLTSRAMKKTVDTLSDRTLAKIIPAQGEPNLEILTPAIQGRVQGVLAYRAIVMHNEIQVNLNNYQNTMLQLATKAANGTLHRSLKSIRNPESQ